MSGNSTLARVLNFRRSIAAIDRASVESGAPTADAAASYSDETVLPASGAPFALAVELPSLRQVTVVAGEHQAIARREGVGLDPVRDAVTVDAISAIEEDIASLLSTMSELSDGRPASAAASDEADDGDDATLTLLSELDRLWQADPVIGAAHHA